MRMIGSAAIMLTWVACGRLTAYFEADLNAWDLAAGAVLDYDMLCRSMVPGYWANLSVSDILTSMRSSLLYLTLSLPLISRRAHY
jgi:hypothetical protein